MVQERPRTDISEKNGTCVSYGNYHMKMKIWGLEGDQKSVLARIWDIKSGAENGAKQKQKKTAFGPDFGSILGAQSGQKRLNKRL